MLAVHKVSTSWQIRDACNRFFTQPGEGTITVSFTGELNDKMKGFYRSKYTTPEGKERYAAVTQFEVRHEILSFSLYQG